MKAQSAIVSTILLTGVILSIVTATYIWGRPLVEKTTDKIKIDTITNDLINIMNSIEHTQKTGSPSQLTLNIKDGTYQISADENALIVKTTTLIPVISSYNYIPITYTELAYEIELIMVNTSSTITGLSNHPSCYAGGDIHFGNLTLNNQTYNITVYNSGSNYDCACIYQGTDVNDIINECAREQGTIIKNGIDYTISWMSSQGTEVIISGGEKENIGILGTDPAGVVSGKSTPGKTQQVTIKLSYRGLRDTSGRIYRTVIQCENNCRIGSGIKKLRIERERIERTSTETIYYLKAYFE